MDKILVVDDEQDILNLVKVILEGAGYQVITALNAGEAQMKAEAEVPDLIFLDVVMPGRSGFETCKFLKFQPSTAFIPVVMFTTLGRDVDKRYSEEAGADGHFMKPFSPQDLVDEAKKHVEMNRPHRFSKQSGIEYEQLRGEKVLLEFDPSAPYERFIRDMAFESLSHDEEVIIFTQKGSVVHQAFKGDEGIIFSDPNVREETLFLRARNLKEHVDKSLLMVYDNLTDMMIASDFKSTYAFMQGTLSGRVRYLPQSKVISVFLINPKAHDDKEVFSLRGLFSNHMSYGKDGVENL